jgi:hypothetical protein
METENVVNPLPGRQGQYSLFRTHHTVKLVAGDNMDEETQADEGQGEGENQGFE